MRSTHGEQSGFTLPELLVVGGVLLIFLIVGAILINPTDRSSHMRNAERRVELAQMAQMINRYVDDNRQLPPGISEEEQFVGASEGEVDLCAVLVPDYADNLPFDPLSRALGEATSCPDPGDDYITAYAIKKSDNTVTIIAPLTEADEQMELILSY